jgi:hypothetical protein
MLNQRRDANEALIVAAMKKCGAYVGKMDKNAGFDLLVSSPRGVHIVEVKDPKQGWALTKNEAAVKREIELAGGAYYIVETPEEAVGLLMDDREVVFKLLEK